jgi:hypothetical protein
MRNLTKRSGRVLCAVALAAALGGCSDFINNVPGNENHVQEASAAQLFTGIQLNTWLFNEGHVARLSSLWLNQIAGIDRQFSSLDKYVFGEDEGSGEMASIYTGGGLQDIRSAREQAEALGYGHLAAVLKIHEAFLMGMASSVWGDLPYSAALNPAEVQTPLDTQQALYASLQTLLDGAIAQLNAAATGGDAATLADRDMSFGHLSSASNTAAWRATAYSLKARLYMHWVEAQAAGGAAATAANTACAGNCVAKALAAAQLGIATSAWDWNSLHGTAATEQNWWYQFNTERSGYTGAGALMVDSLAARTDPRLGVYFTAPFVGSHPGEDNGSASVVNLEDFIAPDRGIALVTCGETQFIIAEAQYRLGATAAANAALQAGIACEEARLGVDIPNPPALTGAVLYHEIMMQKYFALFLNMEAWNDYKRTCQPNVAAVKEPNLANKPIPARLYYGQSERQSNSNLPLPGTAPNGLRNTNDPITCASVLGLPGA